MVKKIVGRPPELKSGHHLSVTLDKRLNFSFFMCKMQIINVVPFSSISKDRLFFSQAQWAVLFFTTLH